MTSRGYQLEFTNPPPLYGGRQGFTYPLRFRTGRGAGRRARQFSSIVKMNETEVLFIVFLVPRKGGTWRPQPQALNVCIGPRYGNAGSIPTLHKEG